MNQEPQELQEPQIEEQKPSKKNVYKNYAFKLNAEQTQAFEKVLGYRVENGLSRNTNDFMQQLIHFAFNHKSSWILDKPQDYNQNQFNY